MDSHQDRAAPRQNCGPQAEQHSNGLAIPFVERYESQFLIACVGAPADDLEAYKKLLSNLAATAGIASVFATTSSSVEDNALVPQLASDLQGTREELQEMVEAVQTSVENSTTSTEEALSMNDELQSANEELESSKEEMHSLNEELISANHRLQSKVEQLEVLNDDMANLLRSTSLATLCLDLELRIQWFTPGVTVLLHLLPIDVNRPIAEIAHKVVDPALIDDATAALRSLNSVKKGLALANGQLWMRQIVPYRTNTDVIKGVVITFMNVTEIQLADQRFRQLTAVLSRIQHLATHDYLTALPNRLLLDPLATQAFAVADRTKTKVALLFIDIDEFKVINDSRGHQFGDQVLGQIAKCLKKCVRGQDFVLRHGGDEFIVMLTGLSDAKAAGKATQRILTSVARPYKVQTEKMKSTVSIGLSLYPDDAIDLESLVRNADTAMYQAKIRGAGSYRFFTPETGVDFWDPDSLEYGLTHALEQQEFILEYQPQVNILSGQIIGAEALVRWQHPELGLLKPSNFIAAAENSGLIVALGEWVLRTACLQLKQWKEVGLAPIRLCINLSAVQIAQIDFAATVARVLADCSTDPTHLEFEITESTVMHNMDTCIVRLQQLRQLGIGLTLDDFGTGYLSLSHLRQLPIDRLKIDVSFVRALTSDVGGDIMVKAISSMARSLGIAVLAEGVETRKQVDLLKLKGCNEMQGYYFSPAVPAQALDAMRHGGLTLAL